MRAEILGGFIGQIEPLFISECVLMIIKVKEEACHSHLQQALEAFIQIRAQSSRIESIWLSICVSSGPLIDSFLDAEALILMVKQGSCIPEPETALEWCSPQSTYCCVVRFVLRYMKPMLRR